MAILRTYSATLEQNDFAQAAVARYRFNEGSGATVAVDVVDDLDGSYENGVSPDAAGSIGDGAASFDGSGFVVVDTPLSGTVRIATLGDSLATGLDSFQPAGQTFADDLPAALEAHGLTVDYFDHAIPGDQTTAGLARVDDVIQDDPDVVILELGTNDALNDIDLDTVESNLRDIITQLRAEDIQVLVTGTFGWFPERNGGNGYDDPADRDAFEATFGDLVAEFGDPAVLLLQDAAGSDKFLGGERDVDTIVGGVLDSDDPSLQSGFPDNPDGLHPNAAGIDQIVERVTPQTIALGAAAGTVVDGLPLASGSFEIWFTTDAIGERQTLFSKNANTPGAGRISAQLRETGELAVIISGDPGMEIITSPGLVEAGIPTHVVFTFGAGGMQLFVDGALEASGAFAGGLNTIEPLVIGTETGFSSPGGTLDNLVRFFQGTIDEFAVYNQELSADEIAQLFEGGVLGSEVVGTADADTIIGGSDAEELRGAGGADTIEGNDGNDELRGGGGPDTVRGGQGDDELYGGRGADELRGGAGNDVLDGKDGGDVLAGGDGDDLLQGSDGADLLSGAAGNDELVGNKGIDTLDGGAGDDLLNGGNGKDLLTGGAGSDTFQIDKISHGVDKIFDFEDGEAGDVLDLSAVLNFDSGDNIEDFVRLTEVSGNTKVEVDPNGGGDDFTTVFNLIGTTGLNIGNLVNDGNVDPGAPTS